MMIGWNMNQFRRGSNFLLINRIHLLSLLLHFTLLFPHATPSFPPDDEPTGKDPQPLFMNPIFNVTIPVGRDAQLPCNVDHLSSYKVAWLRVEDKGILTIHDHVITRNYRINLIHTEEKQFTLLIKNVQPSDAGGYMCQINTTPMQSQVGFVEVVVPPQILSNETSTDVVAQEGSNVSLECRAKGNPVPRILWKREDRKEIPLQTPQGKKFTVHNMTGESLQIYRVARVHMGAFLCIASNGIQPSVSRRVSLKVQFPPALWIPSPSLGGERGQEVVLSCHIEAYPSSVNYWIREPDGKILESDASGRVQVHQETKDYKTHLMLTIRSLHQSDVGVYTCLAKNSLGAQEGSVKVYEVGPSKRTRKLSHLKGPSKDPLTSSSSSSSRLNPLFPKGRTSGQSVHQDSGGGGGGVNEIDGTSTLEKVEGEEEENGDEMEGNEGDPEDEEETRSQSSHFSDSSANQGSTPLWVTIGVATLWTQTWIHNQRT